MERTPQLAVPANYFVIIIFLNFRSDLFSPSRVTSVRRYGTKVRVVEVIKRQRRGDAALQLGK